MSRGGLYVWRTRKPGAVFGLPLIGRHFGYGGRTSSFYHREGQHLGQGRNGGVKRNEMKQGGKPPAPWSDLDPKPYRIPFPDWMSATEWRRQNIMEPLETLLLAALCPVYNDKQQAPWNLRKISRADARAQRAARDAMGRARRWILGVFQIVKTLIACAAAYGLIVMGWL